MEETDVRLFCLSLRAFPILRRRMKSGWMVLFRVRATDCVPFDVSGVV